MLDQFAVRVLFRPSAAGQVSHLCTHSSTRAPLRLMGAAAKAAQPLAVFWLSLERVCVCVLLDMCLRPHTGRSKNVCVLGGWELLVMKVGGHHEGGPKGAFTDVRSL